MRTPFALISLVLATGLTLSACGGGDDDDTEETPYPSNRAASVTVTSATAAGLNGVYTSNGLALTDVAKVNPVGDDPETCRFKFSGLDQTTGDRLMDGDIRYLTNSNGLQTAFISIDGAEFRIIGSQGTQVVVDKPNHEVDFNNALLTSTEGGGSIRLTGSIPMRAARPQEC